MIIFLLKDMPMIIAKKRLVVSLSLVAGTGVAVAWLIMWWASPRVDERTYAKIKLGMSRAEIERLLNSSPHHGPGEELEISLGGTMASMRIEQEGHVWVGPQCRIYVVFDERSVATHKMLRSQRGDDSLLAMLRRWVGLE